MTPTYKKNLERIDATVHTRSSNLYGTMDNDDMFQYLGGLSMAVAKVSGKSPEVYVSMQKKPGEGQVEPLAGVLGRELRARYLNPVWIEGMKREGYAGAREMSDFVEIFWGWQVTTPGSVGEEQWNEIHETYMEDKNGLSLDEFFQRENPWAKQAFAARLLESVRKGYWNPSESVRQTLTEVYLKSVLRNGVACSDFICDNPSLTRMVAEAAATAPGLAPSDVQQFVKAMAKASGRSLAEQEAEKKEQIQKNLPERSTAKAPSPRPADRKSPPSEGSSRETGSDVVKGLVMETVEKKQIPPAEPLHPWLAALVLLVGIALFGFGVQKNREERAYAHYGRVSPR